MTKRSVVAVVLLSIFTCGIYELYWLYTTKNELNAKAPEEPLKGILVMILLTIITCGIYGLYWYFKFYQKADKVLNTQNLILYFILSIFGLGIVAEALLQDSFNHFE